MSTEPKRQLDGSPCRGKTEEGRMKLYIKKVACNDVFNISHFLPPLSLSLFSYQHLPLDRPTDRLHRYSISSPLLLPLSLSLVPPVLHPCRTAAWRYSLESERKEGRKEGRRTVQKNSIVFISAFPTQNAHVIPLPPSVVRTIASGLARICGRAWANLITWISGSRIVMSSM